MCNSTGAAKSLTEGAGTRVSAKVLLGLNDARQKAELRGMSDQKIEGVRDAARNLYWGAKDAGEKTDAHEKLLNNITSEYHSPRREGQSTLI